MATNHCFTSHCLKRMICTFFAWLKATARPETKQFCHTAFRRADIAASCLSLLALPFPRKYAYTRCRHNHTMSMLSTEWLTQLILDSNSCCPST